MRSAQKIVLRVAKVPLLAFFAAAGLNPVKTRPPAIVSVLTVPGKRRLTRVYAELDTGPQSSLKSRKLRRKT